MQGVHAREKYLRANKASTNSAQSGPAVAANLTQQAVKAIGSSGKQEGGWQESPECDVPNSAPVSIRAPLPQHRHGQRPPTCRTPQCQTKDTQRNAQKREHTTHRVGWATLLLSALPSPQWDNAIQRRAQARQHKNKQRQATADTTSRNASLDEIVHVRISKKQGACCDGAPLILPFVPTLSGDLHEVPCGRRARPPKSRGASGPHRAGVTRC